MEPARRGKGRARRSLASRLSGSAILRAIAILVVLAAAPGCVTRFRTGIPLEPSRKMQVSTDLAIAGVLSRRPGETGSKLPRAAARMAKVSGAPDESSLLSESELVALLGSPAETRSAIPALQELSDRVGHRYVLVAEASTAPTDELKTWIIQIVVPIPFVWIFYGIPVQYASNVDVPHAITSARVIDLETGEILAASFEAGADLDEDESPPFHDSAVNRAVNRMAVREK